MSDSMVILATTSLIIGCFSMVYFIYLMVYGGGAGFSFFWIVLGIMGFVCRGIFKNYHHVKTVVPKVVRYPVFALGIALIIVFLIVQGLIIKESFNKKEYPDTDYVVVLGAGIRGTQLSLTLWRRLNVAYDYLIEHPESQAILSGGQGPGEDITEAEAMRRYLKNKGIDEHRLLLEERSTSTQENIAYSFELMDQTIDNPSITIVTSDFHVYRAKHIAKQHGKEVEGVSSHTSTPLVPNYYIREFFAVMKDVIL
ncbi:YdcF family protein [Vallitalea pronyensis]|uniref:YdcF family protein n=1 Tax=Vallitalea pronyensis TaxID=1348613 RepID=A0A8J8MNF5_9FIRM|nr:YdcF family protein [Vallitalea pronyensis]QUI24714.1 YdcF family protein [Vallitalea pronyensis]